MAETWLVLDGLGDVKGGEEVRQCLGEEAARRGLSLDVVPCAGGGAAPCLGCFGCWIRTPGTCVIDDAVRDVTAKLAGTEVVVLLSPVVFGGYGGELKTVVERGVLPTLLPHFQRLEGRTRHFARYEKTPDVLAVGLLPREDAQMRQVFSGIVARNAANMLSKRQASTIVCADDAPESMRESIGRLLEYRQASPGMEKKRVALLCGSPRRGKSVSRGLAGHVEKALHEGGTEVVVHDLYAGRHDEDTFVELAKSVDASDGVFLFAPLYADQLPGHVLEVLTRLAAWRREISPPGSPRFAAAVNCGFPESENNDAALATCRLFAREAGLDWMGGCAVGGGGLYEGRGLASLGFMSSRVRRALEAKARLLVATNRPDFADSGDIAVPCPLPARLYLFLAEFGWKKYLGTGKGKIDGFARPHAREASEA
ncbi:NAD(P)H-dependent oxidoreductase [Solidesulfovibrio sp.]|uniref:NAD(P)H-dependent oxidoreductase n=1 Tax=Solidesulfovibrio sp. TaxID=2910990 RepID=UPI0026195FA9|nr:NAD(P)H-dependent oxidoreductase [Solidesulfovibrio sp.]